MGFRYVTKGIAVIKTDRVKPMNGGTHGSVEAITTKGERVRLYAERDQMDGFGIRQGLKVEYVGQRQSRLFGIDQIRLSLLTKL